MDRGKIKTLAFPWGKAKVKSEEDSQVKGTVTRKSFINFYDKKYRL